MREQEKSITLLGNQGTKYPQDYAPEVLETFVNKHPDNDYFVKFNCPELPVYVRSQGSRILQRSRYRTYQENEW